MKARLACFTAGAAATGAVWAAVWLLLGPNQVVEPGADSDDFYKAFAIHGPLDSDWTRVHQVGELDVWSDAAGTALAITENGRAVQLLTLDDVCCTFDIFEQGEYRATVKYGNFDQRLMSQGVDPDGKVWTYVDMGINGTIDFRFLDGVSNSAQQVIMTQFAGETNPSTQLADHNSDSGW
jgi:hypothetical protein